MSREPQTLYEEDEKERGCDLLRSVNLKPQNAGVHLEALIYHAITIEEAG